jgi:hypothetical protein
LNLAEAGMLFDANSLVLLDAEDDFGPAESRGPFLTSPLGANFNPSGEVVPRG